MLHVLRPGFTAGAELTMDPLEMFFPLHWLKFPPALRACFQLLQCLRFIWQLLPALPADFSAVLSSTSAPKILRYPEKSWKRKKSQISLLVMKSFHTLPDLLAVFSFFHFFFSLGRHLLFCLSSQCLASSHSPIF